MRKSINKTTVIVVLALFLTLSIGYALFSDTITIEGTATAQGNFDIAATCQTGVAPEILTALGLDESDADELSEYPNFGYENDSCSVSGDTVIFSTDLKHPGSARTFTVKLTNVGSVDAIIEAPKRESLPKYSASASIKVYDSSTDNLYEEITDSYNSYYDSKFFDYMDVYPQIRLDNTFIANSDGSIVMGGDAGLYENEFIASDGNNTHYLRLKPNQSAYIVGQAFWDEDSEINGYYAEAKTTFNFEFTQMSSDMKVITDPSKDNICFNGC